KFALRSVIRFALAVPASLLSSAPAHAAGSTRDAFEGVLNGVLPSGEAVAQVENRRAGVDLTFSMPKSASVMAYVAGDKRVLGANMAAVKATMAWVEKNLAEGRRDVEGRKVPV